MMKPGDIAVLPTQVDQSHLRYIEQVKDYESGSLRTLSVEPALENPCPLSYAALSGTKFRDSLLPLINTRLQWELHPYIADEVAFCFSESLKMPVRFGFAGCPTREAADVLNDKRLFRAIASGLGVPIAPGRTCQFTHQLASAVTDLIDLTGSCIIKLDRHSGADGNVLVSKRFVEQAAGCSKTYHLGSSALELTVHKIYDELARGLTPFFVVESYYDSATPVGAHFNIEQSRIDFLGIADIRFSPAYDGMSYPSELSGTVAHKVIAAGHKLAVAAVQLGHRGPLSVDGIILPGVQ